MSVSYIALVDIDELVLQNAVVSVEHDQPRKDAGGLRTGTPPAWPPRAFRM